MTTKLSVDSSAIKEIEYDEEEKSLFVTFNGGNKYEYVLVPLALWEGLKEQAELKGGGDSDASVGKYFSANIRSTYQGIKIS